MRYLIINADGYGFTSGITQAIEECIQFGTVRSISANVNFRHADRLQDLVRKNPELSVGCHLNPVVGRPVLPPEQVPTLVDQNGEFFYKTFSQRFVMGKIRLQDLRAEMFAQVEKTRGMVGSALSHLDFHMGLHRWPGLYEIFLDVAEKSGVRRIRTHRYFTGMEHRFPIFRHYYHLFVNPVRIPKYVWNLWLRKKALDCSLAMPDRWVEITNMGTFPERITIHNYLRMVKNLPQGFNEFVAHPAYIDDELKRWSTYLEHRTLELQILLNPKFRDALYTSGVQLAGYCDIPLDNMHLN